MLRRHAGELDTHALFEGMAHLVHNFYLSRVSCTETYRTVGEKRVICIPFYRLKFIDKQRRHLFAVLRLGC